MLARLVLARNCFAPTLEALLVEIAQNETDITVKHALAERKTNPMQVWEKLAADKDPRVQEFLRKNPNIPEEILEKLPKPKEKRQLHKLL